MSFNNNQNDDSTIEHVHRGAIVRIRLQNFMTYEDAEIKPGPGLNMVLGPNGTGKSAIVCCIIVGLAGEVNLTGRGGSPADFVKKNTNYATTEIELFNDYGNNYVITRIITITHRTKSKLEHKSEWKINNKPALKAAVQSLTKKLNIKVDNLCQFLPQDSVTQFVKMNTCDLLLNTLKAVGDNELVENHQNLVLFTGQIDEKQKALESLKKSCEEDIVDAQRLEGEVRQLKERSKLVKQKNICSEKIYYAQYLEVKQQYENSSQEFNNLKTELKEKKKLIVPYEKEVESKKSEDNRYRQTLEKFTSDMEKLTNHITKLQDEIENLKYEYQEESAKFRSKKDEESQRENTKKLKHQELRSYQDKYAEAREVDCTAQLLEYEDKLKQIKAARAKCLREKNSCEDHIRHINSELEKIRAQTDKIKNINYQKAQLLKKNSPDAWQVMEWISMNRDKFSKRVFNPIMCEINVKDPKFNATIENAIPRNDLLAFLCQTEQDVKTLTQCVREDLRLKLNVVLVPDKTLSEFEAEAAKLPDLRNLGVRHYLKDLIDAPDPIMRYLCGNQNFHRIPVVENCPEEDLNILLTKCQRLYANEEFFTCARSRYDNQMMTARDRLREARLLVYSLNTQGLEECRANYERLQEQREVKSNENSAVLAKDDKLKEEWQRSVDIHNELKDKHEQKRKLEKLIETTKKTIDQLESEKIDIENERRKLQQSIEAIDLRWVKCVDKLEQLHMNRRDFINCNTATVFKHKIAAKNHKIARKKFDNAKRDIVKLDEFYKRNLQALAELTTKLEFTLNKAVEKIPGLGEDGHLDSKTRKRFDEVSEETVEELTNKREDLGIRIQRIFKDANNTVESEYKRKREALRDKQQKIDDFKEEIKMIESSRNQIKQVWITRLDEVIKVINANYQQFMRRLRYDGEVKLDFDEAKPDDFSEYGVLILVKYRDGEQLIPLSSTRQSGGERSVATMIYMLALQAKTTAPFRCVDEINQGMDKENERKVFELLVHTADSSSSQYFLVSPKLLPNLPYSSKMRIHVILNGAEMKVEENEEL